MKICKKIQFCLKSDNITPHKCTVFECNFIRPLGEPRRKKYYANASEHCVIITLPILLSLRLVSDSTCSAEVHSR